MGLAEAITNPPGSALTILLVTLAMSAFTGLITRKITDQQKLQRYRKEIAEWRRMTAQAKKTGDEKLALEVRRRSKIIERMQKQVATQQFKPTLIFIIPFFVLYAILGAVFGGKTVAVITWNLGLLQAVPIINIFVGIATSGFGNGGSIFGVSFFGWYLFCSFSFGMMMNRILGIKLTGT